jgi:hypothetical protein
MMIIAAALAVAVAAADPSPTVSPTPLPDPCGSINSLVTRPTISTSACTVRPHHVLVENGWSNTITTGPGGGATTSFTQTFIHFGTWDPHLEFAVTPPNWNRSTVGGAVVEGASDVNVGAKYELGYDAKAAWGVNGQISIPTGDVGFTAGGPQYTGNFDWGYTLNSVYGLAGTIGVNSVTGFDANGDLQRFAVFEPALVLSAGLSANAQAFAEYAYVSKAGPDLGAKSVIDFGLVRVLTPNSQADVEYGYSPTAIAGQRQHYIGIGFSFMN